MELEAVCLIAEWSTHKDARLLCCLSKDTHQRLGELEKTQNFWRNRVQNLFFDDRCLPDKAACWRRVYDAAVEQPSLAKECHKLSLHGLFCLLHESAITLDISALVLLMLDDRLTTPKIERVARRLLDPHVSNWDDRLLSPVVVSEPLTILITDRRVDVYGWLGSQIKDVFTCRGVIEAVLDKQEVRARLTEDEIMELGELLRNRKDPTLEQRMRNRSFDGVLDKEESKLINKLWKQGWMSLLE